MPDTELQPLPTGPENASAPSGKVTGNLIIALPEAASMQNLTPNCVAHLTKQLSSFAQQVVNEARAIERTEHVGAGPPEITAAHIDESWWVSRRRIRRARHPILTGLVRIIEGFGTLAVSIGFTNVKQSWGIYLFITSVLVTSTAYVVEMQLTRSE